MNNEKSYPLKHKPCHILHSQYDCAGLKTHHLTEIESQMASNQFKENDFITKWLELEWDFIDIACDDVMVC